MFRVVTVNFPDTEKTSLENAERLLGREIKEEGEEEEANSMGKCFLCPVGLPFGVAVGHGTKANLKAMKGMQWLWGPCL